MESNNNLGAQGRAVVERLVDTLGVKDDKRVRSLSDMSGEITLAIEGDELFDLEIMHRLLVDAGVSANFVRETGAIVIITPMADFENFYGVEARVVDPAAVAAIRDGAANEVAEA